MFAFGLDISRWQYPPDGKKLLDFEVMALHSDPIVSFVFSRSGVSWGYTDAWFARNWAETRRIDRIREDNNFEALPVGRGLYHVLYPGENVLSQVDAMMAIAEANNADWEHDKIVMDNELDHGQSKRRITDAIKDFAYLVKKKVGFYPINYTRTNWMFRHTYYEELSFMDNWLAQYRRALPYPLYTPEYNPPPVMGYGEDQNNPRVMKNWLVHQTAEHGKPIGSYVNWQDYNRWNGDEKAVAEYFGFTGEVIPEPPQELTLEQLFDMHVHPEKHPAVNNG